MSEPKKKPTKKSSLAKTRTKNPMPRKQSSGDQSFDDAIQKMLKFKENK